MTMLQDAFTDTWQDNTSVRQIGKSHLNKVIHQPVRLRIMAVLMTWGSGGPIEFTALRGLLGVTDGNLGAHLQKLENAHYIELCKTAVFRGRELTYATITESGRKAFREHSSTLSNIINWQQ